MVNATPLLERTEETSPDCCLWEPAGKAIAIRVRLDVVERLEREALETFRAVAKRGSEVGGLLLGRVSREPHSITVEDYEIIACDYSRGPLYQLSEADERQFHAAIARPRASLSVVGYFRSNTRKDLALDSNDLAVVEKHFSDRKPLVLLVKPFSMKPSLGAWFLGEDGYASPAIGFTFRRGALEQRGATVQPPPAPPAPVPPAVPRPAPPAPVPPAVPRPTPPAPVPPAEPPPNEQVVSDLRLLDRATAQPHPTRRGRRWLWLPLLAALAGGGAFLGYRMNGPILGLPIAADVALALKVERTAGQLWLSWNRSAPAVASAQKATLSILDGTQEQILNLDLGQLRTGSLVYTPSTGDVVFRLEVTDLQRGKSLTESIRAVAGRPSALGPPALKLPEQAPDPVVEPEPQPEAPPPAVVSPPNPEEPVPAAPPPVETPAPPTGEGGL